MTAEVDNKEANEIPNGKPPPSLDVGSGDDLQPPKLARTESELQDVADLDPDQGEMEALRDLKKQVRGKNNDDDGENRNLIINYLPPSLKEDDVMQYFAPYGKIEQCKIVMDLQTKRSKGYGFVKFISPESAQNAINALNGFKVMNKQLKVAFARKHCKEIRNSNLYVTHLPKTLTDQGLKDLFEPYGKLVECRVLKDEMNKCRGVGFVRFDNNLNAVKALKGLNKTIPKGYTREIRMKLASKRRYPPRGNNPADAAPFVPQADAAEYPPPYWPYPPYWGMPPTPGSVRDKPGMHPPPYMMPPPYGPYFWPGAPPSPYENMPGSSPRRSSKNRRNSGPMGGDWEEFYSRYPMPYPYPYPHPGMQPAASPRYPGSPRFQDNPGFRSPRRGRGGRGRGGGNFSPRRKSVQRFNPQRTAVVTGIADGADKDEVKTELTGMFEDLGLHSVHVITPKGSTAIRAYLNFRTDKAAETAVSRDGTQLLDNKPLKITLKSVFLAE